jgi:hypothetical protein
MKHKLTLLHWDEYIAIRSQNPNIQGIPIYCAVDHDGRIAIWPCLVSARQLTSITIELENK